jgi:hypothetical protein
MLTVKVLDTHQVDRLRHPSIFFHLTVLYHIANRYVVFVPGPIPPANLASDECKKMFQELCTERTLWEALLHEETMGAYDSPSSRESHWVFAAQTERLGPRHHYSLLEKSCPGCQ